MNAPLPSGAKHPRGHRFPYILKYMEALLREAHYNVKCVDLLISPLQTKELLDLVKEWGPELIVVSSTARDHGFTLKLARAVKELNSPITICVGQDATARPAEYLFPGSSIDLVLRGDAEFELLEVIRKINNGHNIAVLQKSYSEGKSLTIADLDALPFPRVTAHELQAYHHIYPVAINRHLVWGHILSSRGCPYPCMFCTEMIRETTGEKARFRSAANVVDEIEYLARQGANIIIFDDDNFTTSSAHVKNICEEMRRRNLNIPWVAHARVDNVGQDLLLQMKAAGCVLLRFGIESGSSRIIKILEKTANCFEWLPRAKDVFQVCKNIGISTSALFMIGSPTETKKEIEESIRFARELSPDMLQVSFFTYYPDTRASKRLKDREKDFDFSVMYHFSLPQPRLNPSEVDNDTLQRLQRRFYRKVLLDPRFFFRHVVKYGLFYLHNPAILQSLSNIGSYLTSKNNVQFKTV